VWCWSLLNESLAGVDPSIVAILPPFFPGHVLSCRCRVVGRHSPCLFSVMQFSVLAWETCSIVLGIVGAIVYIRDVVGVVGLGEKPVVWVKTIMLFHVDGLSNCCGVVRVLALSAR
jgi:hypothetical protein